MSNARHVPQRTCIGCRTTSGKRNGRGAYLCARTECWHEALKRDRLARALRTTVSTADAEALRRYAERFRAAAVVS